jgi:siroheme synthase-like protein
VTTGYPAILQLQDRLAVVVGCGQVGGRKVRTLLEAGARVRVIAPSVTEEVEAYGTDARVEIVRRAFRDGDLAGAAVVVAATDDRATNERVSRGARDLGIPVNVVDDVELSTFIAPSIVRRGDLLIAISTGGVHPALAVRLRERFEREFGDEYARYLQLIDHLKGSVQVQGTQRDRAEAWYRVVDSDVFELVRAGRLDEARARATQLLEGGTAPDRGIVSRSSPGGP